MAERRAAGKNEGAPARDLFDLMGDARDPETGRGLYRRTTRRSSRDHDPGRPRDDSHGAVLGAYLLALDPADPGRSGGGGAGATVDGALDIERLKFTRAVIDETMRLYPPAFLIARAAGGPDTIAGSR